MAFLFVYIQEAHTADGWQVQENLWQDAERNQPVDAASRTCNADACCSRLNLSIPCVVDTMANDVDTLYAGFPERLYVVDRDGSIAYAGKMGPWGFKPEEAEEALLELDRAKRVSAAR